MHTQKKTKETYHSDKKNSSREKNISENQRRKESQQEKENLYKKDPLFSRHIPTKEIEKNYFRIPSFLINVSYTENAFSFRFLSNFRRFETIPKSPLRECLSFGFSLR